MIAARAIQASLHRGRHRILHDVSLEVRAGEVLAVVGPNGGGKSSLLQAFAGLLRPSAGRVEVGGVSAWRAAIDAAGAVGLITAAPGLYPLLTGRENLAFFGSLYGLSAAEVTQRVAYLARDLDLEPALDRPAGTASSGTQQKLSLARAVLMSPPVLLLDEPTANLDPFAADVIHRTLRAYADDGNAVVWVTHDLHAAEHLCDAAVLVAGTIAGSLRLDGARTLPSRGPLTAWWSNQRLGAPA